MSTLRPDTVVYFAKCVGMSEPIKIGCTRFPAERAVALASWAPFPVEIIATVAGGFRTERRLHAHFAHLNSHAEWFRAGDDLLELIAGVLAGRPLAELIDMNAALPKRLHSRPRTEEQRKSQSKAMKAMWARKRARAAA